MYPKQQAFTLMELVIVILIIGVLAAAVMPIVRGKVDQAKWAEAHALAGAIRRAAKMYHAETGNRLNGRLSNRRNRDALGITNAEVEGTYFIARDFRIRRMDNNGNSEIRVIASQSNAPAGRKTLTLEGQWQ